MIETGVGERKIETRVGERKIETGVRGRLGLRSTSAHACDIGRCCVQRRSLSLSLLLTPFSRADSGAAVCWRSPRQFRKYDFVIENMQTSISGVGERMIETRVGERMIETGVGERMIETRVGERMIETCVAGRLGLRSTSAQACDIGRCCVQRRSLSLSLLLTPFSLFLPVLPPSSFSHLIRTPESPRTSLLLLTSYHSASMC